MNRSLSQEKRFAVQQPLLTTFTDLIKDIAGKDMKLPPAAIPKFNHLYQELSRIDERRNR